MNTLQDIKNEYVQDLYLLTWNDIYSVLNEQIINSLQARSHF